jgi:hypothetical protein
MQAVEAEVAEEEVEERKRMKMTKRQPQPPPFPPPKPLPPWRRQAVEAEVAEEKVEVESKTEDKQAEDQPEENAEDAGGRRGGGAEEEPQAKEPIACLLCAGCDFVFYRPIESILECGDYCCVACYVITIRDLNSHDISEFPEHGTSCMRMTRHDLIQCLPIEARQSCEFDAHDPREAAPPESPQPMSYKAKGIAENTATDAEIKSWIEGKDGPTKAPRNDSP